MISGHITRFGARLRTHRPPLNPCLRGGDRGHQEREAALQPAAPSCLGRAANCTSDGGYAAQGHPSDFDRNARLRASCTPRHLCHHEAIVSTAPWPDDVPVPVFGHGGTLITDPPTRSGNITFSESPSTGQNATSAVTLVQLHGLYWRETLWPARCKALPGRPPVRLPTAWGWSTRASRRFP